MDNKNNCLYNIPKEGLDLYGQRFIDSFAKRVDKKIKLLVYAEDCVVVNEELILNK